MNHIDTLYKNRFDKMGKNRVLLWQILCKKFLQQYVSPKSTVLDVAAGYGEFINTVSCRKKIACDSNMNTKKHLNKDVQFLHASSTKLPLKDNAIDTIFVSNLFEHLTHKEIIATIEELLRVLKPGGNVLVLQPNIRFAQKDYWMFFDHITPVDDRGLTEGFCMIGFLHIRTIEKFLPFTTKTSFPQGPFLLSVYLSFPFLWSLFGKQSFLIFRKPYISLNT